MPDTAVPTAELGGLPGLAHLLSRRPHPDEVVSYLVEGPFAPFTAFAGILLWCKEPSLRMLGLHGYTAEEAEGFEEIPLAADLPITRAAREGEIIIGIGDLVETEYSDERLLSDPGRWERLRARVGIGTIVSVPIVAGGVTVGAVGFTCREERAWSPVDLSVLDAVSRLLGLWLRHPDSGIPWGSDVQVTETLTDRQCRILQLVRQGKTNDAIGAHLGYSSSTVKQELTRVMRILGVTNRQVAADRAFAMGLCGRRET